MRTIALFRVALPLTRLCLAERPRLTLCFTPLWCALTLGAAAAQNAEFPEYGPATARDYLNAVLLRFQAQETLTNGTTPPEACFALARTKSQLGEKADAEQWARRGLQLAPGRGDLQLFLADVLVHQDRMQEARDCLQKAVDIKVDLAGAQRQLGAVLDRLGDREGARKAFEMAVAQYPRDATARLLLGRLLLDLGEAQPAASTLHKACELDPSLSGAFYALSQAQTQLGEVEAARESLGTFQRLKQREKNDLDARNLSHDDDRFMLALAWGFHVEAGNLLLAQKLPALAEAHFRQAVRLAPKEPTGYEALASMLHQSGRLTEAAAIYEQLVALRPKQVAYLLNLGTLLLELKDFPKATETLRRALELDPQQPQVLANLARFYLSTQRDLLEALALSRRLAEVRPTAASYDLLGWAYFANGRTNEARAAAAEAVQREPTNTTYRARYQRLQSLP